MFYFGVDYYPEHWPEARWAEDARLMAEAGFTVVRLAEFAWSKIEPRPGDYDFEWLDRAIDILAAHGIQVVLGTPTASPPPWLMARDPTLFRVLLDGRRVAFGLRREYCPNHPGYRRAAQDIVSCMAEHYGQHPNVIGWQIDNEFGDRCYCPICTTAFHAWLQERYGTLDEVNQRWGTVFWSHHYTAWDQIPAPSSTAWPPNPGLGLDYSRFCSDSYVTFQQQQIDILREKSPGRFITHNFMGFHYDQINYFDLAARLDLVAWDNYPSFQWNMDAPLDPTLPALSHDTMRSLKQQPFWVMEQQAGPAGWDMLGPTPRPGKLRLWAYQAIAHGADGVVFFRWRTATVGAEQNWHGILDHHGRPGRRYEEIRRMGAEIRTLSRYLEAAQPAARVGILLSYDSRFSLQLQRYNPNLDYTAIVREIYRVLHRLHVTVDLVAPDGDLSPYRLVIAPVLHVVSETVAENLRRFAEQGGVLLVTARSGVKDDANRVVQQPLPGLLAELCGIEIEEYDSLPPGATNSVRFVSPWLANGQTAEAHTWCEVLQPNGAEVLAEYQQDYYAGRPAITMNHLGAGHVIYCGALGGHDLFQPLLRSLLETAGVAPVAVGSEDLEIVERRQGDRSLLFVLNHHDEAKDFALQSDYINLLDGAPVKGTVQIGPNDLVILAGQNNHEG